jgi:hypothetical protein
MTMTGQKDFREEALRLCSIAYVPSFGNRDYADPTDLVDTYESLQLTADADRLSAAVAELLDHGNADVRVLTAFFFARHPTAAGRERLLDVIESGPRVPISGGDGEVWPGCASYYTLRACFREALTAIAATKHPRALALLARNDVKELLERTER